MPWHDDDCFKQLDGAYLATLIAFWKRRPVAGMLLVPYLGWVAFATALNFAIWHLNQ